MTGLVPAGIAARIWARDDSLWAKGEDLPSQRLGWLTLPEDMTAHVEGLEAMARTVAEEGYRTTALLGMGGSSLAPELFGSVLGAPDYPRLVVFDSTHPDQIRALEEDLDVATTLFVVASKSGTTAETRALYAHFRARTPDAKQFLAITDPGTPLETLARTEGFRSVFLNPPDVGGRYSALSLFGVVPAALVGADLRTLLGSAQQEASRSRSEDSQGQQLGEALAAFVRAGEDKLTIHTARGLRPLADWIEQLLAESTGKQGTGVVPIVGEPVINAYGPDRRFVALGSPEGTAPPPDVERPLPDLTQLGAELFGWEFATAVAGVGLGINPFDQPDVEAAKRAARAALESSAPLEWQAEDPEALFAGMGPPEYAAVLAFAPSTPDNREVLTRARRKLATEYGVAAVGGFGPRYLHSSGQLYKGGPKRLRALVALAKPDHDLEIPGEEHSFGRLVAAQASGDVTALRDSGQRVATISWDRLPDWASP